jgi:hypothetical protein
MRNNQLFWVRASGVALIVCVLGAALWIATVPAPRVKPAVGEALAIDKSPAAQREREATIDELVTKGLIRPIEPGRAGTGVQRVSLRPAFYTMDEATRRKYIEQIYAYFFDGSSVNDTVILRDAQHGNEIGQYNPYRGGLKMYK